MWLHLSDTEGSSKSFNDLDNRGIFSDSTPQPIRKTINCELVCSLICGGIWRNSHTISRRKCLRFDFCCLEGNSLNGKLVLADSFVKHQIVFSLFRIYLRKKRAVGWALPGDIAVSKALTLGPKTTAPTLRSCKEGMSLKNTTFKNTTRGWSISHWITLKTNDLVRTTRKQEIGTNRLLFSRNKSNSWSKLNICVPEAGGWSLHSSGKWQPTRWKSNLWLMQW